MLDIFIVDIARQASLGNYRNDLLRILDKYEVKKFSTIRDAMMRERYLACRWVLRRVVSIYINLRIFDVNFEYNSFGKPFVRGRCVDFNLSHSGDSLVVGVSDGELGVDIEKVRPINLDVARRVCTKNELSYICREQDEYDRFFRLWTLKEAYAKKIGEGFYFDFRNMDISLDGSKVIQLKINNCVSESVGFFTKKVENNILSLCSNKKNVTPRIIDFEKGWG